MSTNPGRPLRLPAAAVPAGCPSWSGEHPRRWLDALPPRWVPLPSRTGHLLTASAAAVAITGLLALPAGWRPWAAALLALHALWLYVRPEIVPVSAPVLAVLLVVLRPGRLWPAAVIVLASVWAVAVLRLVARRGQRERARDAAGGITAPLPGAGRSLPRGLFLVGCGGLLFALGVASVAVLPAHPGPDAGEGARALPASAWLVAGLGLTALVSGLLGRRRAAVLRAAAPVLRVLVREGADGDTEVFAADDTAGVRPLFRVAVMEVRDGDGQPDDPDEDDTEELEEFLQRLDREGPGPLREAVLYGAPCDGAEILLVTAAGKTDAPPVVERSSGPVRPLSEASVRRLTAGERRRAARRAAYAELSRSAGEAVAAEAVAGEADGAAPTGVRQWRAGLLHRLCALLLVLWGSGFFWGATGGWRGVLGALAGFVGALWLPHWLAWRITADSEGLWFNGLRGPRHLPWDEIRTVACTSTELKVDSRRASFTPWSAAAPRWPWLERRFGLVHPHERAASEITALWRDPSLRPSVPADAGRRGRPLWPLALALAAGWTAALLFLW
ncbi:hypothetical protein SHJG_6029 [Streptomyces hygroscopicus subsp. jinggangensis 5008]|nr:hypothetical protein SHJG_6029 [Streptomyces hygroscopicus subsp. jinggangensis 5008]AGF65454.1 hypothetical protein SHJGH_5791 [Streptomyces hygroscopicus subsp. jinggangensis TL01]